MLFATPELTAPELGVLDQIDGLRVDLKSRLYTFEPRRWLGSLRRASFARAVRASNSIEGYDAELDDVAAVDLGEDPLSADEETRLALKGYHDAMTFVLRLADEPDFHHGEQLLKSLHFIMTGYDLKANPGLWRPGSVHVTDAATREVVYEGADRDDVPRLMRELVRGLEVENDSPVMVRAAMSHLNLVMIHPFSDGNGRMARVLQTLVLARERILDPVFCSIEEYLGANTPAYYDVLGEVGGGHWQPERDPRPWLRFILTAHLRQARTILRRVKESDRIWSVLETVVAGNALPDRVLPLLFDASLGYRVRNSTYRALYAENEVTDQTASRDLRLLVDRNLLVPHGEKRGRYYTASSYLRDVRKTVSDASSPRDESDPFAA